MGNETKKLIQKAESMRGMLINPDKKFTNWDRKFLKNILNKIDNGAKGFSAKQKLKIESLFEVSSPSGLQNIIYDPDVKKALYDLKDKREKQSNGTYRYAYDCENNLIFIDDLKKDKKRKAPYKCPGCGNELIPRFQKTSLIYTNHFYHKNAAVCNNETYLHKISIRLFYNNYKYCLRNKIPYQLVYEKKVGCQVYNGIQLQCPEKIDNSIDLTKLFPKIDIEKYYKGWVPDILLSSPNTDKVMFIEMAVTHLCEKEKIESEIPIIEFHISDDIDLKLTIDYLSERNKKIKYHNFKETNPVIKSNCNLNCSQRIYVFIIHQSGKCLLDEVDPTSAAKIEHNRIYHFSENVGVSNGIKSESHILFRKTVQEHHFKMFPIKNCYTCRYHGGDGVYSAVFCRVNKESVSSNQGVSCTVYKSFQSLRECQQANESNDLFVKKRLEKNFICKMMGGRL